MGSRRFVVALCAIYTLFSAALPAHADTYAYVANQAFNNVSVISLQSNSVITAIPVGSNPYGIAASGTRAYVANLGSNTVSVIDLFSNTVINTIGVGANPYGVAISADGTRAYVSNGSGFPGSVSVINTTSDSVITTISDPSLYGSRGIAITPDASRVYVANEGSGTVSVIDTASSSVVAVVGVGSQPVGVVVSPDGSRAYVAVGQNPNLNGSIAVINTSTNAVIASIQVGPAPTLPAITRDGTRVYVPSIVSQGTGSVFIIDTITNAVVDSFPVAPGGTYAVAVSPDGARLAATAPSPDTAVIIDTLTKTVLASASMGAANIPDQPSGIAIIDLDTDVGLARLAGGNTFTGTQSINGNLTANFLFGDGSGLINLNPANLTSGTAQIDITGSAGNSAKLGGVAAASYARLDVANTFTGTTTMGSGGTAIVKHWSATTNPVYPLLKGLSCATALLGVPVAVGASDGDTLALGVPSARMVGGAGVILIYSAWVSSSTTITIQACNLGASPQKTATTGAIRVDLWKH